MEDHSIFSFQSCAPEQHNRCSEIQAFSASISGPQWHMVTYQQSWKGPGCTERHLDVKNGKLGVTWVDGLNILP